MLKSFLFFIFAHLALSLNTCNTCTQVLSHIQNFFEKPYMKVLQPTEKIVTEIATAYCIYIKADNECSDDVSCRSVCDGMIAEEAPVVFKAIFQDRLPPRDACALLHLCQPATYPHQVYIDTGARNTTGTGRFIHISDIHVDLLYKEGSSIDCDYPLCCRNGTGNSTHFAGKFGPSSRAKCDVPMATVDSLLEDIKTQVGGDKDIFGIITGDFIPHDVWKQSEIYDVNDLVGLFDKIQAALPDIPFYPCLGNHEAFPVNEFQGPEGDSWLYETLYKIWGRWLDDAALVTLRYGGYYSTVVKPGLRLIALNTGYYQDDNLYLSLTGRTQDMGNQRAWLKDVLGQAEKMDEKVYITGHVPLGSGVESIVRQYIEILCEYSEIIAGIFMGHTHNDEFRIVGCNGTGMDLVAFLTSSITTYDGHIPAWRMYDYERRSGVVMDYKQRSMDIVDSNQKEIGIWSDLYNTKEGYGVPVLSSESVKSIVKNFLVDDKIWNFYTTMSAGGGEDIPTNRAEEFCKTMYVFGDNMRSCMNGH